MKIRETCLQLISHSSIVIYIVDLCCVLSSSNFMVTNLSLYHSVFAYQPLPGSYVDVCTIRTVHSTRTYLVSVPLR